MNLIAIGINFLTLRRLCCVAAMFAGISAYAVEPPVIVMVEEDWELVINHPHPESHSPQVTFFTAPLATNEGTYFQLQMN